MNINKKIELAEEYLEVWEQELEKAQENVEDGEEDLRYYRKARQMGYKDDEDIDPKEMELEEGWTGDV